MSFLGNRVYDNGLNVLDTEANIIHICSSQPSTYADLATVSLGNSTSLSITPPSSASSGRKVTVAAITDGAVTASGEATHWAIADTINSRLLAAKALTAPVDVVNGGDWTLPEFTIRIPDPKA